MSQPCSPWMRQASAGKPADQRAFERAEVARVQDRRPQLADQPEQTQVCARILARLLVQRVHRDVARRMRRRKSDASVRAMIGVSKELPAAAR